MNALFLKNMIKVSSEKINIKNNILEVCLQ